MRKTNIGLTGFVARKLGTPYVYGMKGSVMTLANFNYLQGQYGVKNVWNEDRKKVGKVCVDCSGLISWYTGKVKGSSQFYAESEVHGIESIAKAPIGAAVWRKGHIGVYMGNGEVIEARGSAYGVVRTRVEDRDFTHWFLLRDVDYIEREVDLEMVEKDKMVVNGKEVMVDMIRKDGVTFVKTRDLVEALGGKVESKGRVPVVEV